MAKAPSTAKTQQGEGLPLSPDCDRTVAIGFPYNDKTVYVACGHDNTVVFSYACVCAVLGLGSTFTDSEVPAHFLAGRCRAVDTFDEMTWVATRYTGGGKLPTREIRGKKFVTEHGLRLLLAAAAMRDNGDLATNFETWVYDTLIPEARQALRMDPHPKSQSHDPNFAAAKELYDSCFTFLEIARKTLTEVTSAVAALHGTVKSEVKNDKS